MHTVCYSHRLLFTLLQVRVVVQIVQDLVPYLVILLVALLSFAAGLSVLLFNKEYDVFSSAYDNGDFSTPTFAGLSVLNYGLYSEFGDFFDVFSIEVCARDRNPSTSLGEHLL